MYVFHAPDLDGKVIVTLNGRKISTQLFDGEVLHDYSGRRLSDKLVNQVDIEGLINNGTWKVMG